MRKSIDESFIHRQAMLKTLSPKELEEYERRWQRENKKEYERFKE